MSVRARGFTRLEEVEQIEIASSTPLDAPGRLLALDLGARRVGVAICDELRITTRPLPLIERRSWKYLLRQVATLVASYDVKGLVIGLPLRMDGDDNTASREVREVARKFQRSLALPIYLQDERLTTVTAKEDLRSKGQEVAEIERSVDSEAAAIILRDFITSKQS